jgi:hypothetical protein
MSKEIITEQDLELMTHDTQVWKFGFCVCSECERG